jgi:predicted Zn-dependent protease
MDRNDTARVIQRAAATLPFPKKLFCLFKQMTSLARLTGILWLSLSFTAPCGAQILMRGAQSDVAQGADVARAVEREIGLYKLPAAEKWVQDVGARLAAAANDARWQFNFHIADQAEPNAFAIPGGGVYVSRGLLALITTEDELAGVLGHEIAHVTQRHSARQQRRGIIPGLLAVPGNIVGSVVNENLGALINAPVNGITSIGLSRYGRGQETESDRVGARTAAGSGYDPAALATILDRLERDVAMQTGQQKTASLFASHPMTSTRLADIRANAPKLPRATAKPITDDTASVYALLAGMWAGPNPEVGIFRGDRFMHPQLGFSIEFPQGWQHSNSPASASSTQPTEEAALLIGIDDTNSAPDVVGQAFVKKMRAEAKAEPESIRTTPHEGVPVYAATYLDRSGRQPFYMHFVWARLNGTTYHLMGIGLEKHQAALRKSARSLRLLTDAERKSVTGKRIRVATATSGEALEQFCTRTRNAWPPAYTALVNGLDPKQPLVDGQLLKITVEEPAWVGR